MEIIVTQHSIDLNKKNYIVTIEDDGNIIVNRKNIGCETTLNANGEIILDGIETSKRIKNIVSTRRAERSSANVDIDLG